MLDERLVGVAVVPVIFEEERVLLPRHVQRRVHVVAVRRADLARLANLEVVAPEALCDLLRRQRHAASPSTRSGSRPAPASFVKNLLNPSPYSPQRIQTHAQPSEKCWPPQPAQSHHSCDTTSNVCAVIVAQRLQKSGS